MTALSDRAPRVFISYSWESDAHKAWVLGFACELVERGGVDVVLDRWHLQPGDDKTYFMEQSVATSDYVLVVCTETYARKSNARTGGVGYEAMILTGTLAESVRTRKFIPVLREGEWEDSTPLWLRTRFGPDLRGDPCSPEAFEELLRTLYGAHPRPPDRGDPPIFAQPARPRRIFAPAIQPRPVHEAAPSSASGKPAAPPASSAISSAAHLFERASEGQSRILREVKTSSFRPVALGALTSVVVTLLAIGLGLWATHSHSSHGTPAPVATSQTPQSAVSTAPAKTEPRKPGPPSTPRSSPSEPSSGQPSAASPPGKKDHVGVGAAYFQATKKAAQDAAQAPDPQPALTPELTAIFGAPPATSSAGSTEVPLQAAVEKPAAKPVPQPSATNAQPNPLKAQSAVPGSQPSPAANRSTSPLSVGPPDPCPGLTKFRLANGEMYSMTIDGQKYDLYLEKVKINFGGKDTAKIYIIRSDKVQWDTRQVSHKDFANTMMSLRPSTDSEIGADMYGVFNLDSTSNKQIKTLSGHSLWITVKPNGGRRHADFGVCPD